MTLDVMQGVEICSRVAAGAFVSGIWQGVVLAVAVGLCLHAVPKTTAAIRFTVWSAVFLVLALLPMLRSFALRTDGVTAGRGAMLHAVHVDVRWSFAIAAVWVLLSGIRAVGLVSSAVRLRRIWKRATPVDPGFEFGLLRVGSGRRVVQICTSADVDCPSVIGFFSPRVLIPVEMFGRLTATELEQIVLHEVGHLRRADDWINLLQKIGLVVFPLNPALLWVERRLCFERELACDDGVLRLTKAPKAYATCLTTLAEHSLERRGLSLSLGAWERQSELSRRVHSILRWREGMGRTQARVMLGVLVLGLLGGATGLARCPQLVSFSAAGLPLAQEAQAPPTGDFQNVVFRPTGAAHETLLRASMPSPTVGLKTTGEALPRSSHNVSRPALRRAKKIRSAGQQQWLVLTSWNELRDESGGARLVLTVAHEQTFTPSYAAVRTADGWLVFQL
jgi:beta-lactamase regulating signal transducer with metallopeptidase domain